MRDVTRQDLRELRDELVHRMDQHFGTTQGYLRSIEAEAKATNGRLRQAEIDVKSNSVRITNVEREIFPVSKRPAAVFSPEGPVTVTLRDVWVVLGTVSAMVAVQKWLIPFIEMVVRR